jgi:hypothetical protein
MSKKNRNKERHEMSDIPVTEAIETAETVEETAEMTAIQETAEMTAIQETAETVTPSGEMADDGVSYYPYPEDPMAKPATDYEEDPEILDAASDRGQIVEDVAPSSEMSETPADASEPIVDEVPVDADAQPLDAPPDPVTPAEELAIESAETVSEVAAAVAPPVSEAMRKIAELQAQIEALKAARASKRVASGSKARPNVVYTLLSKPPQWHSTPQVAQLQQILFDPDFIAKYKQPDGSVQVTEPELFAQVAAGQAAGVLRTSQEPVRIFQYYRSQLLTANCLRWR